MYVTGKQTTCVKVCWLIAMRLMQTVSYHSFFQQKYGFENSLLDLFTEKCVMSCELIPNIAYSTLLADTIWDLPLTSMCT